VHLVVMPKLGLTMQEAELVRWLVDVDGGVRAGRPLCEVETDKITMEVESPVDGVLLRRVEAGVVVAVGVGIAVVGEPGEDVAGVSLHGDVQNETHFDHGGETSPAREEIVSVATQRAPSPAQPATPVATRDVAGRRPVAPVARRLAEELGVDLSTVAGTGPGGRIVRRDVEAAAGLPPGGDPAED
jgi:pyruvate dehydrogenase E2 component (dihydrolipoamide acetyltransferase)